MSHFRVVWPDEECQTENDDSGVLTAVLPYVSPRGRQSTRMNIIARAQALFSNRTCPHCQYPVVEPIELDDAAFNHAGLPIPGTASLVGFHCTGCDAEWAV